jgi:hypothetical protein
VLMGSVTNLIVGTDYLVISDELTMLKSVSTRGSPASASSSSSAMNNMGLLEKLLREVNSQSQPRTHRLWKMPFIAEDILSVGEHDG